VPGAAALPKAELSILLTDDKHIRVINRQWRQKDKATDVLSFPLLEEGEIRALGKIARRKKLSPWYLGDIVISLPRAAAQAEAKRHSVSRELETLLIHGFLHLLGYDHVKDQDAAKMERLERKILGS
jgi:probable rRNA maturation factor